MINFNESEPLTYDKLNEMIKEIVSLRNSINAINNTNKIYPLIDVILAGNETRVDTNINNKIQIIAGIETIAVKPNSDTKFPGTVYYKKGFGFAATPILVCTVQVEPNLNKINATVQTTSVNKTQFKYKIVLAQTTNSIEQIRLNYIAIGRDA